MTPMNGPPDQIQAVENGLDSFWDSDLDFTRSSTDIYEQDGVLNIEIYIPGFQKDEIRVSIKNQALEVFAKHHEEKEDQFSRHYFLHETNSSFLRRMSLPENIRSDRSQAAYQNGILKISMPVYSPGEFKRINVEQGAER